MAMQRKITISKGKPPMQVAKKAPTVRVIAKPAAPAPIKVVAKPAAPQKERPPRFTHPVTSQYTGPSKGLNVRKSSTRIPVEEFGTHPDYTLTERTMRIAESLKQQYAAKPFQRGNADAAVLKYLGWAGHLKFVSGDAASETAMFQFTAKGRDTRIRG